ncbi:MAG: ribosome silencing factor [Alphaproteobacteria bacterium]|nr:ribosome silencing factor [Alphaproteobacteria bacterium]
MPTALEGVHKGTPPADLLSNDTASAKALKEIVQWLDDAKAEDIVTIPLTGKSSIGDFMVVASGRTDRHVGAVADQVRRKLKSSGFGSSVRVEGMDACDWVLIDTGDIVVHIFRPEVRDFYNLEKMWLADRPKDASAH